MELNQDELLEELLKGSNEAYTSLYYSSYPLVENLIKSNNGNQENAKDIFQDAIIALIKMISKPNFELNAKLSTLLFSISRNLWLKHLRDYSGKSVNILDDDDVPIVAIATDGLEEKVEIERKHELIAEKLDTMGELCQKIIRYFYYQELPHQQIAELMGYTIGFSRIKLNRCRKTLINLTKDL